MIEIEVKRTIGNDEVVLKASTKEDDVYEKVGELRNMLQEINVGKTKKDKDAPKGNIDLNKLTWTIPKGD